MRKFRILMSDYVEAVLMAEALPHIGQFAPAIRPSSEHPSEPLFEDEFTCVVWAGNTRVKSAISLDEYLSLGHIVVRRRRNIDAGAVFIPTAFGSLTQRRGKEL